MQRDRTEHATRDILIFIAVIAVLTATTACSGVKPTARPVVPTPAAPAATTTSAPHRAGPFVVGRRTITFVDTTRPTPAHGKEPGKSNRMLATIIEYPAQGTPGSGSRPSTAPPARGRFPVVVFVHGFSAHADNPYLHYWAAAGYVAVAITFPLTNADTPGGPTYVDTFNEPRDVGFVLSRLADLPAGAADLQPIIDPDHVGIVGQSLGAQVAFDLAFNDRYHDSRVRAAVLMSGGCTACLTGIGEDPGHYFTGPKIPAMFIHGTADPFVPITQTADTYTRTPAPKFFLRLIGAKHVQYGPPWEPIAARATIDFFDRYLKHDDPALQRLASETTRPGTVSFSSKT